MSYYKFHEQPVIACQSRPVTDDFMVRLCEFYRHQPEPELSQIWSGIYADRYQQLHGELKAKNIPFLQANLPHMYVGGFLFGLDWNHSHPTSEYWSTWCRALEAAANSLGTLPVRNPEQEGPAEYDPLAVLASMEFRLGCHINSAGGGEMLAVKMWDRVVPVKLLEAVCLWSTLSRHISKGASVFLELGAGLGSFGHLLSMIREGRQINLEYHTIDLPLVSVLHAYLLALSFGEDAIWLHGEGRLHQCHIFVHGLFRDVALIDAAINHNSLPEIRADQAESYLRLIHGNLVDGGVFYSVNHECPRMDQNRVAGIMSKISGMKQMQRSPFWARQGYVEEVWKKLEESLEI